LAEDIDEDSDIVMQDIMEAAGLVEGNDANGNNGTGAVDRESDIDQNENAHEEGR